MYGENIKSKKELYYSIFFLLDRYCEFNKEKLRNSLFPGLVSSMDPFIFTDHKSADSAFDREYAACYAFTFGERTVNYDEGFNFIKTYLHLYEGVYDCNSEYIFSQLSKKDWEKCCNYAIEFLKGNKN